MGKNKKKEYVLDAVLDEETYMAYKSGQAIDNNGLRSPKGSYWPMRLSSGVSASVDRKTMSAHT